MTEVKIHATWPHAPRHFNTLGEAFDFCQEKNQPVTVVSDKKLLKLYPSGKCEDTGKVVEPLTRIRIRAWGCICQKCNYTWVSMGEEPPGRCSSCKDSNWKLERKEVPIETP